MVASNDFAVDSISVRKRAANRRNAEKSTGPTTPEGKKRSSMNALSHGVFCQDLLLPDEDPAELQRFRDALLISLGAVGMIQLAVADRIVSCLWRLRRLGALERTLHAQLEPCISQLYKKSPDELSAAAYAKLFSGDSERFTRMNQYEQWLMNSVHKCLKELRLLRKDAATGGASSGDEIAEMRQDAEIRALAGSDRREPTATTPEPFHQRLAREQKEVEQRAAAVAAEPSAKTENEPTEASKESQSVQPDATGRNAMQPGATEEPKTENEPTEVAPSASASNAEHESTRMDTNLHESKGNSSEFIREDS